MRLRGLVLLAVVAAALILPRLGHRQIIGSHEAVFPIVARDIVERHAWLDAELRGLPYHNKPPLYPWVIAAFSWSGGRVTEITAGLPSALAAIGAVIVTALLGARLFGPRAGLWAALILLTSILFFDHAVMTIPDVPMIFFDLIAGLSLWSISNGGGARALLGFYVALALAVFTKGVPGLLPLAVALVWLAVDDGRRGVRRLVWAPGLVLFGVATALWLVPYVLTGGDRFVTGVMWDDWLWSMLGAPRIAALSHQALSGTLGFMPWTLVLPVAFVGALRARRDRPVAFALCWFAVQLALVFAMQQQRLRYLLPLLPGAALLVAWWAERESAAVCSHRVLAVGAVSATVTAAFAAVLALRGVSFAVSAPRWAIAVAMLGIAVVGVIATATLWTGRIRAAVPAVAATSAVVLLAAGWGFDDWRNHAWDYRATARDLGSVDQPLAIAALADDQELLQVDFYLGHPLPLLRSPEAVSAHLTGAHGAVLVEARRWRTAGRWLPLDPRPLRIRAVGADLVLVTAGKF